MKNYFSKNLYLQGLRKIRTAGIAMAIIMLAINALVPVICILESQFDFPGMNRTVQMVESPQFAPAGVAVVLFAPILTYLMFSYLNERKSSDFYHALPQKRVCVFISFTAAILTWIIATLLASAILNGILWAFARFYATTFAAAMISMLAYFITALVLVGFMSLAMMLTGTPIANVLVFILFTLFVRAFGLFFFYGLDEIAPMFNATHSWLSIFDITFFLPFRIFNFYGDDFVTAGMLCYWAIVGILLLVGSCIAYHFRKSESATRSAPNRLMQHIYRIGVTFPFVMLMMYMILIDDFVESYHFIFLVFAALVWITYEVLTTKKIKNVIKSLPLFLIPVLLSFGYLGSVYLAREIVYNTTPDREDIVSVELGSERYGYYAQWQNVIVHTHSVDDDDILDMLPIALEETKKTLYLTSNECRMQGYTQHNTLTLTLKSGRKVTYDLQSHFNFEEIFANSDDLYSLCMQLPNDQFINEIHLDSSFGPLDSQTVWNAFREDYNNMTDKEKAAYLSWNEKGNFITTYLYVRGKYDDYSFHIQYNLDPEYTPRAYQFYIEAHNQIYPPIKGLENAKDTLNQISDPENHLTSIEIIGYLNGNGSVYSENINVMRDFLNQISIDEHLMDYTSGKHIYEVRIYIDTDYKANYYEFEDGKATTANKPVVYYYRNDVFYVTLSEEDINLFYELERKYKDNQKNYETETVVVD